jgi:two-component system phosphate regulon sensor histidine kinase PhoR
MKRRSLLWTFLPPLLVVFVAAMLLVAGFAGQAMRAFFLDRTERNLENLAAVTAPRFAALLDDDAAMQKAARDIGGRSRVRFTVVRPDGRVSGDSAEAPSVMDNHGGRPEIAAALGGAVGASTRYSATLEHTRLYVAVPMRDADGRVVAAVRASVSLESLDQLMRRVYARIALAMGVLTVIVGLIMWLVSRPVSVALDNLQTSARSIAGGDLTQPVTAGGTSEIAAVGAAMNDMADQLRSRFATIESQRNELEAVMTSMVEGVLAVDNDEAVIGLNGAAGRLLGQDPRRAMGRSVQEVGRNPALTDLAQRVLAGEGPLERDVQVGTRHDVWLQVHATGLRDAAGRPIGALLVMNDISRLRRLENVRRDFVANVSHELKTPITSIKGFVETILAEPPRDEADLQRFLQIINRQADRLDSIITDLLALSRLEKDTDNGGIERQVLPVASVLDRIVRDLAAREPEAAARVSAACPGDLRAPINAALLEQAVGNLLGNALKYSETDTLVTLECRADAGEILIAVKDNGPGIAAEHLPRLFERFYRVDKARSRRLGGTGLGLAIVKHIAQAHGGRVEVVSEVGRGSTFTLALPGEHRS